ncbi:MAG: hypothetical protein J7J17_04215 [Hadesarchaea archaeon]|nr:hypothetical protein [Hadesarchaea archaeon]
MSQITLGEDLLSVVFATALLSVFILTLANSYEAHRESVKFQEDFGFALSVAEALTNGATCGGEKNEIGIITCNDFGCELQKFSETPFDEGMILRVEVKSSDGKTLLSYGPEPADDPLSVELPAVVGDEGEVRGLGDLTVWVWRE